MSHATYPRLERNSTTKQAVGPTETKNKALFFVFGGVVMIALGVGFNKVNSLVSTFLSHKETNE